MTKKYKLTHHTKEILGHTLHLGEDIIGIILFHH